MLIFGKIEGAKIGRGGGQTASALGRGCATMAGGWEEFHGKRDCEKSGWAQRRAGVSWDADSMQGVDGLSGRGRESGRVSGAVAERDARGSDCGAGRGAGQPDGASGMKVLIDECAPKALKEALAASGFDCTTVQDLCRKKRFLAVWYTQCPQI